MLNRTQQTDAGFSLVEMLAIVLLVGILSAIAPDAFIGWWAIVMT